MHSDLQRLASILTVLPPNTANALAPDSSMAEALVVNTSIYLVDRSRLVREGLKQMLDPTGLIIRGEARTLDELAPLPENPEGGPALVLMGWEPDNQASADLIPIMAAAGTAHCIALADQMDLDEMIRALQCGVRAYLLKDISPESLLHSLKLAIAGEIVFPTALRPVLQSTLARPDAGDDCDSPVVNALSDLERKILEYLAKGYPNKAIANALDLTEGTVKIRLKSLVRKLNVDNRTQAAIWAAHHGIGGLHKTSFE